MRRTDATQFSLSLAAPAEFLAGLPADLSRITTLPLDIAAGFSPMRDLRAAGRLSQLVPHPPGLVHAHGLRAAFVAALAQLRRPYPFTFTAHNLVSGGRLTRIGIRFAGSRASKIIAISQSVADGLIAAGIPMGKVVVIPNGVDVEYFAASFPSGSPIIGGEGAN